MQCETKHTPRHHQRKRNLIAAGQQSARTTSRLKPLDRTTVKFHAINHERDSTCTGSMATRLAIFHLNF